MQRNTKQGLRATHLLLAVLLLLPPGLRLALTHLAPVDNEALTAGELETLRLQLAVARDKLRQAGTDLALCRMAPLEDRYRNIPVEILPLGDPAPSRSVLWGRERGDEAVPPDSACVYPLWKDGRVEAQALVGRVVRTYPRMSLVTVQTLLDPGFRVRFRHQGASGMLCGTGRSSSARPILEIRHLREANALEAGDAVFTEGNDGVYPSGALIGYLERREHGDYSEQGAYGEKGGAAASTGGSRHFVVRAALSARELRTLACVVDLSGRRLRDFFSDAARQGERR